MRHDERAGTVVVRRGVRVVVNHCAEVVALDLGVDPLAAVLAWDSETHVEEGTVTLPGRSAAVLTASESTFR